MSALMEQTEMSGPTLAYAMGKVGEWLAADNRRSMTLQRQAAFAGAEPVWGAHFFEGKTLLALAWEDLVDGESVDPVASVVMRALKKAIERSVRPAVGS